MKAIVGIPMVRRLQRRITDCGARDDSDAAATVFLPRPDPYEDLSSFAQPGKMPRKSEAQDVQTMSFAPVIEIFPEC